MEKETNRKIWSLWGAGLGLIYAIGAMFTDGIGITEAFGMVLGGGIMAILCHTAHYFLYARKGLNPDKKPIWRIIKSVLFVWLLILIFIFSLSILTSLLSGQPS